MKFNTVTAHFKAKFTFADATKASETSVYLNKDYWYPNGYDVYVSNGSATPQKVHSTKVDGNYYNINVADLVAAKDGDIITIEAYASATKTEFAQ